MARKQTPPPSYRFDRFPPGHQVAARFTVVRQIGRGSMGAVYVATDAGQEVALKVIAPAGFTDPKGAHRFEREAAIGQKLNHPGIVRTLDTGVEEDTGLLWLAMEYAPGRTLDRWLASQAPGVSAAKVAVLTQIFSAVGEAHRQGVVHRDMKPENVLVQDSPSGPRVKVLDFGIAKNLDSGTGAQTMAGLGTPLWTAPEQVQPDHVPSPRADVWALGLLAFYVLTGKYFWRTANGSGSLFDLVQELLSGPIPSASERARELDVDNNIPTGFDVWFALAVTRTPSLRHRDARAALAALPRTLRVDASPSAVDAAASRHWWAWFGVGFALGTGAWALALWLLAR